MHKIAILLVTYIKDIEYVERLIPNYKKYNRDKIPLYIVTPSSDITAFQKFVDDGIELFTEEAITKNLAHNSIHGIRLGYINQEIIKLAFWEKKLCENYFCMDSDGQFVRDFYISDFMYDSDTPYTILVEDNELAVEPEYYKKYWVEREKLIRTIQKEIGLVDKRMLTCHGFAILSCKVLESLHNKYLVPNNLTYKDLIEISPYEYSWYNMWLQKDKTIDIQFREHIFKYFHHKNHHIEYLQKGITLDDIARGYLGIVINSNYSRWDGVVSYEDGDIYELSLKEIRQLLYKIIRSLFRKPLTLLVKFRARYISN
ncbi:DUF6492 family protein [Methanolobus profundi]|uniref:Rhamnan synthesis protein F n=1 Tax=Methanolobus profundi TaxID=487685 RepID=A0A1I4UJV0_9EURY|nr:DUF6492 family protein [Methanolobus profundi]SFM89282.1 hypothetical protein SAMN04488696_2752 [Methanolobus profundi]